MSNFDRREFLKIGTLSGAGILAGIPQVGFASTSPEITKIKIVDVVPYLIRNAIFVEVITSEGISGWGECSPNDRAASFALIGTLKEFAVGRNLFDSELIWADMLREKYDLGPGGVLSNTIAGIDCAIWDAKGKILGVPVYYLLGGKFRDKIRAYASFKTTKGDIHQPPKKIAAIAAEFVQQGFTAVKFRMRWDSRLTDPDPDPIFDYIEEVRNAVGYNIDVLVDANNGYSSFRAIEIGRKLYEKFGVKYFEEPVSAHDYRGLKEVVQNVDIRIVAGEHEYNKWQTRDLILQGNPDVLNPDVIKCGGITETKKIAVLAETFNKQLQLHSTRPTLGTAAALALAASIGNVGEYVEYSTPAKAPNLIELFDNQIEFKDGFLIIPDGNGLGLQANKQKITEAKVEK